MSLLVLACSLSLGCTWAIPALACCVNFGARTDADGRKPETAAKPACNGAGR